MILLCLDMAEFKRFAISASCLVMHLLMHKILSMRSNDRLTMDSSLASNLTMMMMMMMIMMRYELMCT